MSHLGHMPTWTLGGRDTTCYKGSREEDFREARHQAAPELPPMFGMNTKGWHQMNASTAY
eukprot:scaffold48673_cov24-Tisochrysis_lutea.AAC.1